MLITLSTNNEQTGVLLSILCGLIAFMECQANFLPEDHVASVRCDIPKLLRKLCLCRMFRDDIVVNEAAEQKKNTEMMKNRVRTWDHTCTPKEGKEEQLPGGETGKKQGCLRQKCEAKANSLSGGEFDEFLVYLVINLPFNFMIACYTVVGPALMENEEGEFIRSDLAGVWQMGSPVAVEMVNLPTTFLLILVIMDLVVAPLLTLLFVKTCLKEKAAGNKLKTVAIRSVLLLYFFFPLCCGGVCCSH